VFLLAAFVFAAPAVTTTGGDAAMTPALVTGTSETSSQSSDRPVDVGESRPKPKHQSKPVYPRAAQRAGVTGVVVIEIIVGASGNIESTKLLEGRPPFDASALLAVSDWEYEPLVIDGEPIRWRSNVTFRFQLNEDGRESETTARTGWNSPLRAYAPAPRFGERGVTEFGPTFGIGTVTTHGLGGTRARTSESLLTVFAGRFFSPDLELSIEGTRRDPLKSSMVIDHYTLLVGATRFMRPQDGAVGVSAKAGAFHAGSRDEQFRGAFASVGLTARAPLSKYVAISANAELFREQTSITRSALRHTGALFSIGFTGGRLRASGGR
jgi:TonB family protein